MKRCSRLLFLLGLFILPMMSFAQTFPIDGTVLSSTANPVPFTSVWVEYPTASGAWMIDTTMTDTFGYFDFGPITTTTQGELLVYAQCGFNNYVYDSLNFSPLTTSLTTTLTCGVVSSGPCVAAFTATPQPLQNPYGYWIQLQTGNNDPNANYFYDFGNGNTGYTGGGVFQTYPGPGTYTICLTVTAGSCQDILCQTITIPAANPCDAQFYYWNNGQNFTFIADTFLYDPNLVYSWNLGDGTTASGIQASHTYTQTQIDSYLVCLFVNNPVTGCSDSVCEMVVVPGITCTAGFGYFNAPGTLDASFTPISSGGSIDSVDWSFGDGGFAVGPTPTHTYANSGYYNVCVNIYYNNGCVATGCQTIFIANNQSGGCDSDFIISQTAASDFYFVAVDSLLQWQDYEWTFGDGSPASQGPYSNHTYAGPGTYTVCLVVTDTASNCIDSTCKVVTVTGNPVTCNADFSYQVAGSGQVFFVNQSTGVTPNSFYEWSFGDGTTSNAINAVHTYPGPGTYNTCLLIQTANCVDTFCLPVTIASPAICGAGFTYVPTSVANTFAFTDSSFSSTGGVTYLWDFGDSTTSTLQNPTHTYNTPGPWFACLTITDSSGCSDTYCTVVQPANIPGTYFVSGVIVTDSLLGTQSLVYLIEHDVAANTLTAVDSQFASFGFYQFGNVAPGSYLVKAGLTPNAPLYSSNLPTYHGDVLTWDLAIATVVTNANVWNLPITLVAGNNPGGPAFIGGLISQGANKDGDPLEGISVMLMTISEDPVTHTMTNVDGEYSFTNLAYGTYIVHVEIPGKVAEDWTVTLDANNPSFTLGDFDVHTTYIDAIGTTSISIGLDPSSVKVYPNPSSSLINIALDLEANGARISLVNSLGAVIETIETSSGNVTEQMNLSDLANGVYLIQVTTDHGSLTHRVIKR